eukprot:TRINITY_DN76818_c0_g1_i1.p1 TRINITY_DN76818_c0_g1~~TRINITY_DN76818_c0_g1_i1.p1  ORF type:complete len:141 (+),score=16.39 TRINITY_DN76818_c0_g1_i1:136-558(+)
MSGGGLFRTDGGVKATSGLDVSDASIAEAWAKVRLDGEPTTWLVLEYESKNKLQMKASGPGSAEDLLAVLTNDEVLFGGIRAQDGKFFRIMCVGEDAGGMVKGRAAAHKNAAFNALEGCVGEVCGNSKEEFAQNLSKIAF